MPSKLKRNLGPPIELVECPEREHPPGQMEDIRLAHLVNGLFVFGLFKEEAYLALTIDDLQKITHLFRQGKVPHSIGKPGSPSMIPWVENVWYANFMLSALALRGQAMTLQQKLDDPYYVG